MCREGQGSSAGGCCAGRQTCTFLSHIAPSLPSRIMPRCKRRAACPPTASAAPPSRPQYTTRWLLEASWCGQAQASTAVRLARVTEGCTGWKIHMLYSCACEFSRLRFSRDANAAAPAARHAPLAVSLCCAVALCSHAQCSCRLNARMAMQEGCTSCISSRELARDGWRNCRMRRCGAHHSLACALHSIAGLPSPAASRRDCKVSGQV